MFGQKQIRSKGAGAAKGQMASVSFPFRVDGKEVDASLKHIVVWRPILVRSSQCSFSLFFSFDSLLLSFVGGVEDSFEYQGAEYYLLDGFLPTSDFINDPSWKNKVELFQPGADHPGALLSYSSIPHPLSYDEIIAMSNLVSSQRKALANVAYCRTYSQL